MANNGSDNGKGEEQDDKSHSWKSREKVCGMIVGQWPIKP